ncbi:hypothetical protein RND71_029737 [Anisodus tanguticus]|uniref:non-specific serine/threonine protein kinase n=1 Tax=Anisodus tanguticus TaxID=243964 RepID=A0AAE1V6L2_9SOLA|nr:hypothetical protein RND71_029737 [Anisodus tanguticus]
MEKGSDGFVRADQIDLKSLDEQLERHLNRAWTMEKSSDNKKKPLDDSCINYSTATAAAATVTAAYLSNSSVVKPRQRHDWEIDPSKLIIKSVIARGTFGTVHRGVYDGLDVAVKLLDWGEEGHRTDAEIASLRAAFTQEVSVWHKLDHPNVTKFCNFLINDVVDASIDLFVVLEDKFEKWSLLAIGIIVATDMWLKCLFYNEDEKNADLGNLVLLTSYSVDGGNYNFISTSVVFHAQHKDHWIVATSYFIGATMGSSGLNIQTENGHIGMPSNICCVVVEYLPGGALKSYLIKNRRKKLAFKVVVQMALDMARGLSYLHSQKIVHRDVKTENMLLDKTRTVKIADFGVARVEASNPNDMTGETGTLGYMAPEVLNGNPYNRKCDVYSFGICVWEIYCCDMPYPDLSFSEVTSAVVRQNLRPEIPRCCPSSLANVMKRCWDANPDKRPEMDEVVSMIEAIDTSKGGGMIPVDQQQGCFCFRKHRGP